MKTLILGKGYVGSALHTAIPESLATQRSVKNPGTLTFDLERPETWRHIPKCDTVIWTFPAMPIRAISRFYRQHLQDCKNLIVLASTSCYKVKRQKELISELSELDESILRVKGEEYLRKKGATILCLAGIYGPLRNPVSWLYKGLIQNPNKIVNLIHLDDITSTIKQLIETPQPGERFNLSDGEARIWRDIGEKVGFEFRMPGERHLSKVIDNSKIRTILPADYQFKNLYSECQ